MSDLRDHTQPCKHGNKSHCNGSAVTSDVGPDNEFLVACPGGRDITIDYEAAIELARTFRNLEWNHRAVRSVVKAALPVDAVIGDTDDG